MNITIFEACRSPEINKGVTEGIMLSRLFKQLGWDFVLYSNDGVWPDRLAINRELIKRRLAQPSTDIIHLAMHGSEQGLALQWSEQGPPPTRKVVDLLPVDEIGQIPGWQNKLIISGACKSAHIAKAFLDAGARGVIAPDVEIPWLHLGEFFQVFYHALGDGLTPCDALESAIKVFPEYDCFVCSQAQANT